MSLYYSIFFFIIGTYLGSLYNIIGYRLPKKEAIIYPSINCDNCNKIELVTLIPIFSYFILRKKCKRCSQKISLLGPIIELVSGILFLVCYLIFGFTIQCLFVITFISMLLIIIVSDYYYMIICDEILVIFGILLFFEIYLVGGFDKLLFGIISAIVSFLVMFLIKKIGDYLFKKESMGGGDIKLLFLFGLVLGIPMSLVSIFLASLIALPVSIITLKNNSIHEIPFGPFLSIAAILLLIFNSGFTNLLITILY